jgi:H+/Cl- antiporter ClcA
MANDLQTNSEPSVTSLLGGIVSDLQTLLGQQLALFRQEVRDDLRKTKEATLAIMAGVVVALLGGITLCFMAAHALDTYTQIPLWGCYGIVGGVLAIIGGALLAVGLGRFRSFNPLPDESAQAFKENVQWIAKPK